MAVQLWLHSCDAQLLPLETVLCINYLESKQKLYFPCAHYSNQSSKCKVDTKPEALYDRRG